MGKNISYQNLDKRLFEQLFREHFKELCNFAKFYVNDQDAAKDIVQEIFINLWNKRDSITSEKSVKSYLYSSVKNRCLNWIRDHKKFRSYVLDIEIEDHDSIFERDNLESREIRRRIEFAMDKLPDRCREIFELSRYEELKYKEIAEKLGLSIKTVEVQVSKALKILRLELKDLLTILLLAIMLIYNSFRN